MPGTEKCPQESVCSLRHATPREGIWQQDIRVISETLRSKTAAKEFEGKAEEPQLRADSVPRSGQSPPDPGMKVWLLGINTSSHSSMLIWNNKTSNLQIKEMRSRINIWFPFDKGKGLLGSDWQIKEHFIIEKFMSIQNKM